MNTDQKPWDREYPPQPSKAKVIFFLTIAILTAFAVLLAPVTFGCNGHPGTGSKVGQIVRVEESGLISKTWEAQLLRGGIVNGSGVVGGQPFNFTIERKEDAIKAQVYMEKQTEVLIRYRGKAVFTKASSSSDGIFLESIEPAISAQ